ncbi:MAG TPA: hypothetical protein PKI03_09170 [Pseudomonadota bacterium]|nr:hypothetical protein [Pseudomonadota bacterium]
MQTGSRRCFECGAIFERTEPTQALPIYCRHDGSLLAPEVIGKRWRIEAFLGPRTGGGIFVAYHLVSGQRAALSLVYDRPGRDFDERMQREVGAQRLLEPHPSLFQLIELGSDRDGLRFFASRLGAEQPLSLALREWRRPSDARQAFAVGTSLLYPLIKLLQTAHSQGIAHGTLDTTQVYVNVSDSDDEDGHETVLSAARLYGLRRIGPGPTLTQAIGADLSGIGQILFQLVFGQPALLPIGAEQRQGLLKLLGGQAGQFMLRALGCLPAGDAAEERFASADELVRELLAVRAGLSSGDHQPVEAQDELLADSGEERTIPGMTPSKASLDRLLSPRAAAPESRTSLGGERGPQPLPALPSPGIPRQSSLSNELQRASFVDLLSRENRVAKTEVVARSRLRASLDGAPPTRRQPPPRPSNQSLEVEMEIAAAEPMASASAELPALHSEPTRDLRTRLMSDIPGVAGRERSDSADPEQRVWLRGLLGRSGDRLFRR